jgi:hypothetical protein
MRLESVCFFQPIPLPISQADKRSPLSTTVRDEHYEISLQQVEIVIKNRHTGKKTHATLFNTCWYIPLEVVNEPQPNTGDTTRKTAKKIKPNSMVENQL